MKTIKAKVHMLPTDDYTSIVVSNKGELEYTYGEQVNGYQKHLYITTDEEIKEEYPQIVLEQMVDGTWDLIQIDNIHDIDRKNQRKIVASTDSKLHTNEIVEEDMHMYKKSLPKIPQSFIEEYCKAGGIDEVLVAVDSYLNIPVGTSVKFNDYLPSTLKEYEGLEGQVIWGIKDSLDTGNNCIKVEFLNQYNNVCSLNASVAHWYESIKHLYYNKVAIDSKNCIIIHSVEENSVNAKALEVCRRIISFMDASPELKGTTMIEIYNKANRCLESNPVEEKMYSREEFETKLKEAFHIGYENCQYNHSLTVTARKVDLDKWIEENL